MLHLSRLLPEVHLEGAEGTIAVDLGCGTRPRNPLGAETVIGGDIVIPAEIPPGVAGIRLVTPGEPLPFDDSSVDSVTGFDFLEHLSRSPVSPGKPGEFVRVMSEIHRILKPGGVFLSVTPFFPREAAFTDPTHTNFITRHTHEYFSGDAFANRLGYGFDGAFECLFSEPIGVEGPKWLWDSFAGGTGNPPARNFSLREVLRDALANYRGGRNHLLWVFRKA